MATVRQTKAIYKKILFHAHHLREALHEAKRLEIIKFEEGKYGEASPLKPYFEMRARIDLTTEKAFAKAFKEEVKSSLKGVW